METVVYDVDRKVFVAFLEGLTHMLGYSGRYRLILVKPNICGFYPPNLEIFTVLLRILSIRSDRVLVGDTRSVMYNPIKRIRALGLMEKAAEIGGNIELVDLSSLETVKVSVPNPRTLKTVRLPKVVLEADLLVDLARAGLHSITKVTAALKNLFGLLPDKQKFLRYHTKGINRVIADVAKVVKPDLVLVEAEERILVGRDPLAVDVIATTRLGLKPSEVEHLRLVAEDRGVSLDEFIKSVSVKKIEAS